MPDRILAKKTENNQYKYSAKIRLFSLRIGSIGHYILRIIPVDYKTSQNL